MILDHEQLADEAEATPLEHLVDSSPLHKIEEAAHIIRSAEDLLDASVLEARRAGFTWGAIGASLGVSRQAAHERFAQLEHDANLVIERVRNELMQRLDDGFPGYDQRNG
ncbi:MAG: hypothetical protein U0V73_09305 [Acidimicrobiia bacterium]